MRHVALLALAACATVAAPPPHPCPPSTPPSLAASAGQLSVEKTTHDIGEILRGEIVSHMFRLTNTSSSDVTLLEVRACCTCATAAMTIGEKRMTAPETAACKLLGTLKPKEHAELTLILDTLDDGCGGKDGAIWKSVRVYFSDRSASPLTLSITGELVTPYTVECGGLHFGTVKRGQTATVSSVVTGKGLGRFKVKRVRPLSDFINVAVAENSDSTSDETNFTVTAELLPAAPCANYQGRIVLELDHPRVRAISIPLSVVVEAPPSKD